MKKIIAWIKRDLRLNDRLAWAGLAFICAFPLILTGIHVKDRYKEMKVVEQYSYNCALNKGVAMRDLEGKLRCVPTFSAKERP